jgi:hypothetical protein
MAEIHVPERTMFLCNYPGSASLILLISHNTSQKTVRRRDSTAPEMAGPEVRWKVKLARSQPLHSSPDPRNSEARTEATAGPFRKRPVRLAATPAAMRPAGTPGTRPRTRISDHCPGYPRFSRHPARDNRARRTGSPQTIQSAHIADYFRSISELAADGASVQIGLLYARGPSSDCPRCFGDDWCVRWAVPRVLDPLGDMAAALCDTPR